MDFYTKKFAMFSSEGFLKCKDKKESLLKSITAVSVLKKYITKLQLDRKFNS